MEGRPATLSPQPLMYRLEIKLVYRAPYYVHGISGMDDLCQDYGQEKGLVWCVQMIRSHT